MLFQLLPPGMVFSVSASKHTFAWIVQVVTARYQHKLGYGLEQELLDRLWEPPSTFTSSGYHGSFPQGQSMKLTSHLNLVLRLRNEDLHLIFPISFHGTVLK